MAVPTVREPIYSAIYALAKTTANFNKFSRVWRPIDACKPADFPVLFQTQLGEEFTEEKGQPAIIRGHVDLHIYVQNDPNKNDDTVAPAIQLNNILDQLVWALRPDPATTVQTLGGLVSHCWISGKVQTDEGTLGTKGAMIVPIDFIITEQTPQQYMFDSGWLYLLDQTNGGAPVLVGALSSIDVEVKFERNPARGNLQFDVAAPRKAASISCRAAFAQVDGALLNQLLFGVAPAAGSIIVIPATSYTIPSTGPYTVSVSEQQQGGDFYADLGVAYDMDTLPEAVAYFKLVTGSPGVGQYSISGNMYTFNAADAGRAIKINFASGQAAGNTLALANNWQGLPPYFKVVLNNQGGNTTTGYEGQDGQTTWVLNACEAEGLAFATRLEKFTLPDFRFSARADASNNLGSLSYSL